MSWINEWSLLLGTERGDHSFLLLHISNLPCVLTRYLRHFLPCYSD